jgi:alpha-glucosidase (family GH31 glycosyl hydrolase)
MIAADAPLEIVPMFVRAGAIIPTGPAMNYVGEKPGDPVTFSIYPDDNGSASTILYEDDGLSPAYKQGDFRRTSVNAEQVAGGYIVTIRTPTGRYDPGTRKLSFVVKAGSGIHGVVTVTDDGSARKLKVN